MVLSHTVKVCKNIKESKKRKKECLSNYGYTYPNKESIKILQKVENGRGGAVFLVERQNEF